MGELSDHSRHHTRDVLLDHDRHAPTPFSPLVWHRGFDYARGVGRPRRHHLYFPLCTRWFSSTLGRGSVAVCGSPPVAQTHFMEAARLVAAVCPAAIAGGHFPAPGLLCRIVI